jgi:hypothetical protein
VAPGEGDERQLCIACVLQQPVGSLVHGEEAVEGADDEVRGDVPKRGGDSRVHLSRVVPEGPRVDSEGGPDVGRSSSDVPRAVAAHGVTTQVLLALVHAD